MTTQRGPKSKIHHKNRKGFRELFLHTQLRVLERHNVHLTEDEYRELCQRITDKQGAFVMKQTNQKTIWKLPFREHELICVYHRGFNQISTVLEPYMLEQLLREEAAQNQDWNEDRY